MVPEPSTFTVAMYFVGVFPSFFGIAVTVVDDRAPEGKYGRSDERRVETVVKNAGAALVWPIFFAIALSKAVHMGLQWLWAEP